MHLANKFLHHSLKSSAIYAHGLIYRLSCYYAAQRCDFTNYFYSFHDSPPCSHANRARERSRQRQIRKSLLWHWIRSLRKEASEKREAFFQNLETDMT